MDFLGRLFIKSDYSKLFINVEEVWNLKKIMYFTQFKKVIVKINILI